MVFGTYNPWPDPTGLTDAEVERIQDRMKVAREFAHPNSSTTMAQRLMGEVALRYQLPQDVMDLLTERRGLQSQIRNIQSLAQDGVVPQATPPMTATFRDRTYRDRTYRAAPSGGKWPNGKPLNGKKR